jgi:hypothetical protein
MNERAFLLCEVVDRRGNEVKIKSRLHDDSEFEIAVPRHDITMLDNGRECWVEVEYSGERERIATITLPKPIIDKGHRITVKTDRIKRQLDPPRAAGKVKLTKGVQGLGSVIHNPGEVLEFQRVEAGRGWLIVQDRKFFIVPFDSGEVTK